MNYYTSDLHLSSIKEFSDEIIPFNSIEEKREAIEKHWNSKINNGDNVYILGDISSRKYNPDVVAFLANLKGQKHLIVGNHDNIDDARFRQLFVEICDYKELIDNYNKKNYQLVLCHYPILAWNGQHRDWIHLYGHTHRSFDDKIFQETLVKMNEFYKAKDNERYKPFYAYNVGLFNYNWQPVPLGEILVSNGYPGIPQT